VIHSQPPGTARGRAAGAAGGAARRAATRRRRPLRQHTPPLYSLTPSSLLLPFFPSSTDDLSQAARDCPPLAPCIAGPWLARSSPSNFAFSLQGELKG
jgi:hypothetical protein